VEVPKIPHHEPVGLGCPAKKARLRSNPSNLSGSYQRREALLTDHTPNFAKTAGAKAAGRKPSVAIIGAGVVGLGIAWRLTARGAVVDVFDRGRAGAGASHAAAGMLAACCEAEPGEEALVALGRDSQARWPGFAEELQRASGIDVELRREGTLVLALTADDQAEIAHRLEFQRRLDLPLEWLSAAATRAREPHVAGKIAGALFSPQDHQVDNRKLVQALHIAAAAAGAKIHEHRPVKNIIAQAGRATGVGFEDATVSTADKVVLAAGAWSRGIAGLPPDRRPPVRPVKGQMLALRMAPTAPLLNHVLWAPGAYLVPRRDGRLIVGGTVEEKGFDQAITAGGVMALLDAAWRAIPAVEDLPIDEIWVGHRPGSRDDAPILGPGPLENLFYATGHHRNGILLAPITADTMARLVLDDVVEPAIRPFGLERFLPARAAE
jgi:glycine oxidase